MSSSPLRFPFSEFEEGRLRRSLTVTAKQLGLSTGHEQARFISDIQIELDARQLLEGDILVRGSIDYDVEQDCVSCLEPVRQHRTDKIDMLFSHESQRPADPKDADHLALDNPDLGYHDGVILDIEEDIAGIILQELPEYPRCSEDCRGLDPHTGINLNRQQAAPAAKVAPHKDEPLEPEWKRQLRDIRLTG